MKSKSKKMSRSTLAIIIMAFVMVAMVAFGATYAYFTATAKANSTTVTTGTVKLAATYDGTSFAADRVVFPGDYLIGTGSGEAMKVTVTTDDPDGNYVAVKISITGTKNNAAADALTLSDLTGGTDLATLLGSNWTAVGSDGVFIYTGTGDTAEAVSNGDLTVIGAGVVFQATDNWTQAEDGSLNTYSDNGLMGATINISVAAKSIQASNVTGDNATIAALMFS
ncbi:MAG: SipW-dependent-type signal peptide-containing protein [Candidatus Onthoplasma sp.]